MRHSLLYRIAPGLLVVMWSSGFVGATLAAPVAPATTTLLWRYVAAAPVLVVVVLALRRRYTLRYLRREAVLGLLGQVGYLYGVFLAVQEGLPAGTAALLASLQPAVVAVVLALVRRGEKDGSRRRSTRQAVGLAIGFVGVALAVGPGAVAGTGIAGALWALGAMLSLSAATLLGTLWSAPAAPGGRTYDVLDSLAVQSVVTLAVFAAVASAVGQAAPVPDPTFWVAVVWLVVLAFVGGYGLYLYVGRTRGPVVVSTWLYLTPAVSAVWAWAMFGETLSPLAVAGFAVSLAGVLLARPSGPRGATPSSGPADRARPPARRRPPRARPATRPAHAGP